MKRRGGLISWLVVGLLSAAPAAAGTRYNAFPGSTCLQSWGTSRPRYLAEGVSNQATNNEWLHLACPFSMSVGGKFFLSSASKLAADGSTCSANGSKPTVTFIDRNTTLNISCTLYVLGSGNAVLASFTVTSAGSDPNRQVRTFDMPAMDFTKKTLFAQCVIPPPDAGLRSTLLTFGVYSCDP